MLVCLLPLTPATASMLAMPLLKKMTEARTARCSILINAGRGGLQEQAGILAALDKGLMSAVSLDVFQQEPLPVDSLFWSHPKVTLTPHAAAASGRLPWSSRLSTKWTPMTGASR